MDPAPLHPSAARVQKRLQAAGSRAVVRELPNSAHSAPEAAAALGVSLAQIAKSLVFLADDRPVLAVLSGADRVDLERLRVYLGARQVGRADAERVRRETGYAIGGVSPVGQPAAVRVLIDRGLEHLEEVWAAAGTPRAVFPTTFAELLEVTDGEPALVSEGRDPR